MPISARNSPRPPAAINSTSGTDDVVELVDSNLFAARLDERVPADVERMLNRMLVLGQETAIFIAPPGSF